MQPPTTTLKGSPLPTPASISLRLVATRLGTATTTRLVMRVNGLDSAVH